jgi:hypothetical protein
MAVEGTDAAPSPTDVAGWRLFRVTGIAGLAATVLILDEAQAAFANARVALGSFAVCCGWVIVSPRFLPRWLGWLAIASGVGLVFSRMSWTSSIFLLPYGLFWLWVLVVAGLLIRRGAADGPQPGAG